MTEERLEMNQLLCAIHNVRRMDTIRQARLRSNALKAKTSRGFRGIWPGTTNAKIFSGSAESGVTFRRDVNGSPAIGQKWNLDINGFRDTGQTPR